jgi:hypothetical protein
VKVFKMLLGSGVPGGTYAPVWEHLIVLGAMWGVAWWLCRRKFFFRV